MTTSKSNGAYDTLISLRDKLTRLNGVIPPEVVNTLPLIHYGHASMKSNPSVGCLDLECNQWESFACKA
jgi:hypothetical protein